MEPSNGNSCISRAGQQIITQCCCPCALDRRQGPMQRSAKRHLLSIQQACLQQTIAEACALAATNLLMKGQACLEPGQCTALRPGSRQPGSSPSGSSAAWILAKHATHPVQELGGHLPALEALGAHRMGRQDGHTHQVAPLVLQVDLQGWAQEWGGGCTRADLQQAAQD